MAFCNLCDREVGKKIKRPIFKVALCILASISSFVFLVMMAINYQQKARSFAAIGTTPTSAPVSDIYLLIPIAFLLLAIYLFIKGKKTLCGICSNEIEKS